VSEANLANIMVMLRKMLGREAIQTISKFGYRFTLPVMGEPGIDREAHESFVRERRCWPEDLRITSWRLENGSVLHYSQSSFAPGWAWLGRTCRLAAKVNLQSAEPDLAEAAFSAGSRSRS
jgi:hypothetical protein